MIPVVVASSVSAMYHWRDLAASKLGARAAVAGAAEVRAACMAMMQVSGAAPFSWDYPPQGGAGEFTWVCPGCGDMTGGYLAQAPAPGRWASAGTRTAPTLAPALECPQCGARWLLQRGCYTPDRRLAVAPPRRRRPPGRADSRSAA